MSTGDKRPQSRGEEIANAVSHGIGLLAALALAPVLIVNAARTGGTGNVVGVSIFATTVALLYLTSTLYHALPESPAFVGRDEETEPNSVSQ